MRHTNASIQNGPFTIRRFSAQFSKQNSVQDDSGIETKKQIIQLRAQQRELLRNYDESLRELHIYDEEDMSEEDRLILRVARIFGECEVGAPKNFIKEVKKYIKRWKTTARLEDAVKRAILNIVVKNPELEDEELLSILMNYCFNYLLANNESVAVKVYSMEVLYNISNKIPEIKGELISVIEEQIKKGTPAIKSIGRKQLKKLYRD